MEICNLWPTEWEPVVVFGGNPYRMRQVKGDVCGEREREREKLRERERQ